MLLLDGFIIKIFPLPIVISKKCSTFVTAINLMDVILTTIK